MYPRNAALDINPAAGTSRLSTSGSKWLWAVLAIHCLALLAVAALGTRPPHRERILHYLFATGLLAGAVCYLAMASGLGVSAHGAYQVFFAKYVYWVVAFPVVAAALGLLSCVSWVAIMFDVVLCWAWVASYLCFAYTTTSCKWGFYALGSVTYMFLAVRTLPLVGYRSLDYKVLSCWANLIWLLHPIACALSDGGHVLGATGTAVFVGILDVLLVPVLAMAFLVLSRGWDHDKLGLRFTAFGRARGRRAPLSRIGVRAISEPIPIPGFVPAPMPIPSFVAAPAPAKVGAAAAAGGPGSRSEASRSATSSVPGLSLGPEESDGSPPASASRSASTTTPTEPPASVQESVPAVAQKDENVATNTS